MMIIPLMQGLMDMVILRINKGFSDNINPRFLSIIRIGYLTLDPNELVVSPYGLLLLNMAKYMRVGVWQVARVALVVVRVDTR